MRPFRRPATLVLAAALIVMMSLPAQAQPRKGDPFVPVSKRLAGMTGGELLTENGRQLIGIPIPERNAPEHACRFAGRNNNVLLATLVLPPTAPVCVVKPGTSIFWTLTWYFCDSDDLLFTEAEQQACSLEGLLASFRQTAPDVVWLSVNGGTPVNVHDERFRVLGPQATAFHASRGHEISFAPAGHVAMLKPLPPGRYVIDLRVVGGTQNGLHIQSIIEVVPGARG